MKCFLHIGTEKTGTTTVQNFFNINRKKLLEFGFIYTKSAGMTNNHDLAIAAYNRHRRDEFTRNYGIDSESKLMFFQRKTLDDLKNEINGVKSGMSSVIFSSEHFHSRLTEFDEISRLKEILLNLGIKEIYIIVYLRRPAEIANSLYSTAIKSGAIMDSPPLPSNPYWNNICNHKNTINKFSSVFGDNAVIPRIFEMDSLYNQSIIDDILHVIGVPENQSFIIPENQNVSLSCMGINILKRLNVRIPSFIDNQVNPARDRLVSYIERHFSGSKHVMPKELYDKYDMAFLESDNWVREKYFPYKKEMYSKDYPDDCESCSMSNTDFDKISDFIADIWNNQRS